MISKELDKRIFTSLFLLILVFGMYQINIILLCVLIIFGALSIFEFNKVLKKDNLANVGAGIMQRPQSLKIINTSSCPCCASIGN